MKNLILVVLATLFFSINGDKEKAIKNLKTNNYPGIIKNSELTKKQWADLPISKNREFWFAEIKYPFMTKISNNWNSRLRKQYNPVRKEFVKEFANKDNILFVSLIGPSPFSISYEIIIAHKVDNYVVLGKTRYSGNEFESKHVTVLNQSEFEKLMITYKELKAKTIELYGKAKFIDKEKYDESLERYQRMTRMPSNLQRKFAEQEAYSGIFINNTLNGEYFHLTGFKSSEILTETDYSNLAEFRNKTVGKFYASLKWKLTYSPEKLTRSIPQLSLEQQDKKLDKALVDKAFAQKSYLNLGATPESVRLQAAVFNNYTEAAMEAVKKGADVNVTTKYGDTPLIIACRNSNTKLALFLIKNKAKINQTNNSGNSPIIEASSRKQFEIVKQLVKAGANVNTTTEDDITPLISVLSSTAPKKETQKIIKFLLKKGAKTTISPEFGMDALSLAVYNGDIESVQLLIENGADINRSHDNFSPIMIAVTTGSLEMTKLLTENGADVNDDTDKQTALMYAVQNSITLTKYLVSKGAKVNETDSYGTTPLMYASEFGNVEIIKFLLSKGADVNAQENTQFGSGNTALMYAVADSEVYKNQKTIVEIINLIKGKGAPVRIKNIDGKTVLDFAKEKKVANKYKQDIINNLQ